MRNPLIKVILDSFVNEYNSGACDELSKEDEEAIMNTLASLKDTLSDKQDKVLTIEETRKYLNCTRQTLNNYVKEGKLRPKKHLGGVLEFRLKDLKQFIKNKFTHK
jgi:hypothetical protein